MDPIVVQHVVPAALMGFVIQSRVNVSTVQLDGRVMIVMKHVLVELGDKIVNKHVLVVIKVCLVIA
jgi:hypothetical protein